MASIFMKAGKINCDQTIRKPINDNALASIKYDGVEPCFKPVSVAKQNKANMLQPKNLCLLEYSLIRKKEL